MQYICQKIQEKFANIKTISNSKTIN